MSERIRKIETDSGVMEQIVKQLTQHIGLPTPPGGYVELTMGNYEKYKRKNDQWLSLPFYSDTLKGTSFIFESMLTAAVTM